MLCKFNKRTSYENQINGGKMTKKNTKKKALGKGLDALFSNFDQDEEQQENKKEFILCSISQLIPNPYQPRNIFDEEELLTLSASIKEYGILQPILVRTNPDDKNLFQIIAGERRLRASKLAGLEQVPIIIREIDDEKMLQISIVENIQRENLNPVEEAKAYKRLVDEFNYTQENLAMVVGKSRPYIANSIRLLNLPQNIQEAVYKNIISGGHARALLGARDSEIQEKAFNEVTSKKLSVRQTENLIKNLNDNNQIKKTDKPDYSSRFSQAALKISNTIGANVKITSKNNNAGKIEIKFKNKDELEKLIKTLTNDI